MTYASATPPAMPPPCLLPHASATCLLPHLLPRLCPKGPRLGAWAGLDPLPLQSDGSAAQNPTACSRRVCGRRCVATGPRQRHPCRTSPSRSAVPFRSNKQTAAVPLEASNANATIASLEALEDKARSPAPSVAASSGAGMRVRGLSSSGSMYAGAKILGRIARLACHSRRAFGAPLLAPFASWAVVLGRRTDSSGWRAGLWRGGWGGRAALSPQPETEADAPRPRLPQACCHRLAEPGGVGP